MKEIQKIIEDQEEIVSYFQAITSTNCFEQKAKDALELLKQFKDATETLERLIRGRSKPLESESDREDMDFYHGKGTADRRDSKIAGMMIALDIFKGKDGKQE